MPKISSRILALLALSLITGSLVSSFTPMAAWAAASLVLTPDKGPAGTVIKITGSGFESSLELKIWVDSTFSGVTTTTDSQGTLQLDFTLPSDLSPGDHTITAKFSTFANTERTQASATFTVEGSTAPPPSSSRPASITLTPSSGPPNTQVTITGRDFDPSLRLTVFFDTTNTEVTGFSDGSGNLGAVTFNVPSSATGGVHEVSVQEGTHANTQKTKAIANFTVTGVTGPQEPSPQRPTPSVTLSQGSGTPGSHILVALRGFDATASFEIYFDSQLLTRNVTLQNGSATVNVTIPLSAAPGLHTFSASEPSNPSVKASANFMVSGHEEGSTTPTSGSASLTVSPSSVAAGGTVTLKGSGFDAEITLKIVFDDTQTGLTVDSDTSGRFEKQFVIPPGSSAGSHVIVVQMSTYANTPKTKASTTFTVTGQAPPPTQPGPSQPPTQPQPPSDYAYLVLEPNSGAAGSQITVKGFNFDPLLTLKISIDDSVTDVTVNTDAAGRFQVNATIPFGIEKGSHTVTALYSIYANTVRTKASATFTVTSSTTPEGATLGGTYAAITVSPNKAPRGSKITMTGFRFQPGITLKIFIDGARTDLLIDTDRTGSFSVTTRVDNTISLGEHTITAQLNLFANTVHTKASAQFTVLEGVVFKPSITLTPNNGSAGTVVSIVGKNFSSKEAFKANFGSQEVPLKGLTVNETPDGSVSFTAKFSVTKLASSTVVLVKATDANRFTASADFSYQVKEEARPGRITDFPTSNALTKTLGDPVLKDVPVKINLMLMGFPREKIDEKKIQSVLLNEYTQISRQKALIGKITVPYASYKFEYNISYVPQSTASKYVDFIAQNHVNKFIPQQSSGNKLAYWSVDAKAAEEWIKANMNPPQDGFSLIVVDTDDLPNSSNIKNWYYYDGNEPDPDTKDNPGGLTYGSANFMIAYGGHYRFQVLDLSAGPTYYQTTQCLTLIDIFQQLKDEVKQLCGNSLNAGVLSLKVSSEKEKSAENLSEQIGAYLRFVTYLRFVPSFLYHPNASAEYLVDIKIFSDDPSRKFADHLNKTLVQQSLSLLEPRAKFTVNVEEVPLSSNPELRAVVVKALQGEGVLDSVPLEEYFKAKNSQLSPPSFVRTVLPIYVIGGYRFDGALGIADDDGKGDFGFVLMGIDGYLIDTRKYGLTNTAIHESGHAFGLSHPHDGHDPDFGEMVFWPFDFSSSMVTYATNNNLPDRLDYDNRDRAITLVLLNQTSWTLIDAKTLLEQKGFNTTPDSVLYRVSKALEEYGAAVKLYNAPNPDYYRASMHALAAYRYALISLMMVPENPGKQLNVDFRVTVDKSSLKLKPGGKDTVTVTVAAQGEAPPGEVRLSTVDLPGFSLSFEKASGPVPFQSTATVTVDSSTPPGKYLLKVFGELSILLSDVSIIIEVEDTGQGVRGIGAKLFPSVQKQPVAEKTAELPKYPENTMVIFDIPASGSIQPYKMAIDKNGKIWYSERNYARIAILDPSALKVTRWARSGTAVADVLAYDKYVFYGYTHGVVRFDVDDISKAMSFGISNVAVTSMTITPDGRYIWFVSFLQNLIGKLDTKNSNVSLWQLPGTTRLGLVSIAVDPVAASKGVDLVWITEQDGDVLASFDGLTLMEYQISASEKVKPTGVVAIAVPGRNASLVWVTEEGTGRVTVFDSQSFKFTRYSLPFSPSTPGYMKLLQGGVILLLQNEGKVIKIDTNREIKLPKTVSEQPVQPKISKLKVTELTVDTYVVDVKPEDLDSSPVTVRTSNTMVSGSIDKSGYVQWDIQNQQAWPYTPTADKNGNLWFTLYRANSIAFISTQAAPASQQPAATTITTTTTATAQTATTIATTVQTTMTTATTTAATTRTTTTATATTTTPTTVTSPVTQITTKTTTQTDTGTPLSTGGLDISLIVLTIVGVGLAGAVAGLVFMKKKRSL